MKRWIVRAAFAADRVLAPLGLVLIFNCKGEPGSDLTISRLRIVRRNTFLPE